MPYRRLPNTDKARIRALQAAIKAGDKIIPSELAFSQATYMKAKTILPLFIQNVDTHRQAQENQIKNNKNYIENIKKARLYISHFIQVLNLAIIRNEIQEVDRTFYGFDKTDKRIPKLLTENQIIEWGRKIIAGENERVTKKGNAILTPRIAVVKVWYDKFIESHRFQKTLKEINKRALNKVNDTRKDVDKIILNIWNEVESHFKQYPADMLREKAKDYGVVYVLRTNEKKKMEKLVQLAKSA